MSSPKIIHVSQSMEELKKLLKTSSNFLVPRIMMLVEIKKSEGKGISKRDLAALIGENLNCVQAWRSMYVSGGITLLLSHKKTGFKPSVITAKEHEAIDRKLRDPQNGLRGYTELVSWIEKEFQKNIHYNTLYKYCVREFGSSVKVARKSHIKKDPQAVAAFKKTLNQPAVRPLPEKRDNLKK
jgi:transposase